MTDRPRLPLLDDRALDILRAVGVPYSWGAGKPTVAGWPEGVKGLHGGIGYDCSGAVQAMLVRLMVLAEGSPDRSAAGLYDGSRAIGQDEAPRLGDMAFYGHPTGGVEHVMLCLGGGFVVGACGGINSTNGDDPAAMVQIKRLRYRPDLLGVRQIEVA